MAEQTPAQESSHQAARVPLWVLARVFLRSLLIQVGFNPKVMQGLGFGYAMYPALRALYPRGEARTAAVQRHLGLFNTHPYFAAAILGGAVRLEEEVAAGRKTPADVQAFRNALSAPLAAIGDAFFWNALRPTCALLAALSYPSVGLWAIAIFLIFYNTVHLSVRVWLFVIGYRKAEGLVALVGRAQFPVGTLLLRRAAAAMTGAVAAALALMAYKTGGRVAFLLVGGSALVMVVLAPRVSPFVLMFGSLALALLGGLFF